jgi:hypothetical protein
VHPSREVSQVLEAKLVGTAPGITFWRPLPPIGYAILGDCVMLGSAQPSFQVATAVFHCDSGEQSHRWPLISGAPCKLSNMTWFLCAGTGCCCQQWPGGLRGGIQAGVGLRWPGHLAAQGPRELCRAGLPGHDRWPAAYAVLSGLRPPSGEPGLSNTSLVRLHTAMHMLILQAASNT